MTHAALMFVFGFLYCLLGFMAVAWTVDRSPWVNRALRDRSAFVNSVNLTLSMCAWPLLVAVALPGILMRARQRRRPAL